MKHKKRNRNGEGTVYQRGDGLWIGMIDVGRHHLTGKRLRKVVTGQSQEEVQGKLLKIRVQIQDGTVTQTTQTVEVFLDFWLLSLKSRVELTSWDNYARHVNQIKTHLGKTTLTELTPYELSRFYLALEQCGVSLAERSRIGKTLRSALRAAVNMDFLKSSPAHKIPLPRSRREEIHPLTEAQVKVFLQAAQTDRLYSLFVLALDTGARQGELFALQVSDLQDQELVISKSLQYRAGKLRVKEPKTASSRRRVRIAPGTHQIVQDWLGTRREGLLFPDTSGGFLRKSNVIRRHFHPVLKRAGLPSIRFHDLRHSTATLLLAAGLSPKLVSERLGHSSIRITLDLYAHCIPTMQEKCVQVIQSWLG